VKDREVLDLRMRSTDAVLALPRRPVRSVPDNAGDAEPADVRGSRGEAGHTRRREPPMRHGESPSFLIWSGPFVFTFGMAWVWLVTFAAVKIVTILDMPIRCALLVGAGVLGTLLGQLAVLRTWRRYAGATSDIPQPVERSTARRENAPHGETSCEVATPQTEVRR
jgi:hypothetical protein